MGRNWRMFKNQSSYFLNIEYNRLKRQMYFQCLLMHHWVCNETGGVVKKLLVFFFLFFSIGIFSLSNLHAQEPDLEDSGRVSTRIVGGYEAQPGAWPWMVGLVYSGYDIYHGQYCGGVLISSKWVLTAAHCVDNQSIFDFYIVSGIHDLIADSGNRFDVKQIIQHPGFSSDKNDYDYALVELTTNAPQTPIAIYSGLSFGGADKSLTGEIVTVIGWGSTSPSGKIYPNKLQQVELPVISNATCNEAYPSEITDNMICAGYAEGGKDSCFGDSGGPLMARIDGEWVHAGVVSWGQGCAEPGFYGVNARSSEAVSFIKQHVSDASFAPQPEPIPPEPAVLSSALFLLLLNDADNSQEN